MPTYNRGSCECCSTKNPDSAYTYGCGVPFTYVANGEDYYHTPIWSPYGGTVGAGAFVTMRIHYTDNTTKDVNVPITDANVDGLYGSNTMNIAGGPRPGGRLARFRGPCRRGVVRFVAKTQTDGKDAHDRRTGNRGEF